MKKNNYIPSLIFIKRIVLIFILFIIFSIQIKAQTNSEEIKEMNHKIETQNSEIQSLKNKISIDSNLMNQDLGNYAPIGLVLFLFGGFCALWAQNTGQNPWTWFFLGFIFSIITVIIILINNPRFQSEQE